jgi:hypothetical protein
MFQAMVIVVLCLILFALIDRQLAKRLIIGVGKLVYSLIMLGVFAALIYLVRYGNIASGLNSEIRGNLAFLLVAWIVVSTLVGLLLRWRRKDDMFVISDKVAMGLRWFHGLLGIPILILAVRTVDLTFGFGDAQSFVLLCGLIVFIGGCGLMADNYDSKGRELAREIAKLKLSPPTSASESIAKE